MVLASRPPVHDSIVASVRPRSRSMPPTTLSSVSSSAPQTASPRTRRASASTGAISASRRVPVGGLGGDAHLDAVGARVDADGRVRGVLEVAQHLVDAALA